MPIGGGGFEPAPSPSERLGGGEGRGEGGALFAHSAGLRYLGMRFAGSVTLLDFGLLILGGGMSDIISTVPLSFEALAERVHPEATIMAAEVSVARAGLADSAWILGAADRVRASW